MTSDWTQPDKECDKKSWKHSKLCPLKHQDKQLENVQREVLRHKSKFCSLTTCNHLTADSPSLSLAWFQTMPTHKTSHNQSESFSCSPTAVRSWPGSNHHAGLTFGKHWDLRRMWPWSMKQRGSEEEEESKQIHYTAPWALSKASFPDGKWDRMTGFWLPGDYFSLLLWQTVCVKITCQWWKHSVMPQRPNSSKV